MTKNNSDTEVLICACGSFEHQAIFWCDEMDEEEVQDCMIYDEWPKRRAKELIVYIHLKTHRNFFKRLWVGIKYAFRHRSRYGAFDEFIFTEESEQKLYKFLKRKFY